MKEKIKGPNFPKINAYIRNMLVLAFIFTFFISPLSPLLTTLRTSPPYFSDYYPPSIGRHEELLQMIVNMVPENASVLTQNNIFPHFSNRIDAYVYPISEVTEYAPNEILNYIDGLFKISEYVVIDVLADHSTDAFLKETQTRNYGIYANVDGIYLFKQDYIGDPIFPD